MGPPSFNEKKLPFLYTSITKLFEVVTVITSNFKTNYSLVGALLLYGREGSRGDENGNSLVISGWGCSQTLSRLNWDRKPNAMPDYSYNLL